MIDPDHNALAKAWNRDHPPGTPVSIHGSPEMTVSWAFVLMDRGPHVQLQCGTTPLRDVTVVDEIEDVSGLTLWERWERLAAAVDEKRWSKAQRYADDLKPSVTAETAPRLFTLGWQRFQSAPEDVQQSIRVFNETVKRLTTAVKAAKVRR